MGFAVDPVWNQVIGCIITNVYGITDVNITHPTNGYIVSEVKIGAEGKKHKELVQISIEFYEEKAKVYIGKHTYKIGWLFNEERTNVLTKVCNEFNDLIEKY